jgi:c-di-GMP-binding flagellar brake protein YcgR
LGRDLSASGVRFTAPAFVPRNTRLVALLSLPGQSQPIRTIAQVVWVQRRPSLEAYDYGIRFVEVTPQDQRTLADYIDRGVFIRG